MMISSSDLNKAAIIAKSNSVSYNELFSNINQYSQLFQGKGYKKIAIYSENRPEWIYSFYSGWQNDCIVVPVDFMASAEDVTFILNDCQPELIFTSQGQKAELERIMNGLTYKPEVVCFGEVELPKVIDPTRTIEPKNIENTAVIIYTSGTTGSPKGVMLSYKNLIANVNGVTKEVVIFTRERQVLILLPLHHIFPLAGSLMAPLMVGGTVVIAPSM